MTVEKLSYDEEEIDAKDLKLEEIGSFLIALVNQLGLKIIRDKSDGSFRFIGSDTETKPYYDY